MSNFYIKIDLNSSEIQIDEEEKIAEKLERIRQTKLRLYALGIKCSKDWKGRED